MMSNLQIIYLPNTKDLKNHYWVYIHTTPSMKYYVGTTHGDKPQYRWGTAGSGYKNNKYLYNAIQKYGWNNILHEAWEVESEEQMYEVECWLISFFESNSREYGYNHSAGGEHSGNLGKNSRSKEYESKYRQTEKRKEYLKKYRRTDEFKEHHREWMRQYRQKSKLEKL